MRKNVLLKDGEDVILPITTAENVIGLGNDETEDSVYVCIWLNSQPYAAVQVPKTEITWREYLDTCSDYENYGLLSTRYYRGDYLVFDTCDVKDPNGDYVYVSELINLEATYDTETGGEPYYNCYISGPKSEAL